MIPPSQEPIEHLFSRLSHELRTPITSLQMAIALLQTHQLQDTEDVESLLTIATESTEHLTHVIENILDWYELTHAPQTLFKQPCNIALLLLEVVNSWQPLAAGRNVHLYLETPTGVTLYGDEYYLKRTLAHILHNAIKFSPSRRQVRLTVGVCQTSESLDYPHLKIAIQDQGIGIPGTALTEIFQPFHQVDSSDARDYGGLGLELAICHEVIQRHHGKIWAESELGKGTTFYILLPIDNNPA